MTRDELAAELALLHPVITDVLGFHDLADDDALQLTPLQRATYEARVYAGGVELARRVLRLLSALQDDE